MRGSHAQRFQKTRSVRSEQWYSVGSRRLVRLPVTAQVEGDDLIGLGKFRNLKFPVPGARPEAVDEQQRLTFAAHFIVQIDAVNSHVRHRESLLLARTIGF